MPFLIGAGAFAVALVAIVAVAGGGKKHGESAAAKSAAKVSPSQAITYYEIPYSPAASNTPEERINALADQHAWTVDTMYSTPAAYVHDMCDSLPGRPDPEQWIYDNQQPTAAEKGLLSAGIPLLCPRWTGVVRSGITGKFSWSYGDGTYIVRKRGSDSAIVPGTYRTTDPDNGCYWERTSTGGDIIDNHFATSAQRMTVTIRASDGQFTSTSCGTWRLVR